MATPPRSEVGDSRRGPAPAGAPPAVCRLPRVFTAATRRNPVTAGQRRTLPTISKGGSGALLRTAAPALTSKKALPMGGLSVAPPAGLEPAAKRLEGACSIH